MLFLIPAFLALSKLKQVDPPLHPDRWPNSWRLIFFLITFLVGLRHEVGGDWIPYFAYLEAAESLQFTELFGVVEPAYSLLNWIAAKSGFGVYLLNTSFASIFCYGLIVFCRNQPRPWLALVVSVPYLITVVAMGYSRQGAAIGLVMLAMVAIANQKIMKFMIWISLATLFHKTAVIMIPLAVLASSRRWFFTLVWAILTAITIYYLLLQGALESLVAGYLDQEYESTGAAIRIAMNAAPATIFLILRKRFFLPPEQRVFWTWMSAMALMLIIILFVSPSSTAVDRIALCWIPLQLFVWVRVPSAMGGSGVANKKWVYLVLVYSAAVHITWLAFSTHSYLWLPYQFYPWVWIWK